MRQCPSRLLGAINARWSVLPRAPASASGAGASDPSGVARFWEPQLKTRSPTSSTEKGSLGCPGCGIPFVLIWDMDVVGALLKGILDEDSTGVYNVAGDGILTMKEMARIMGKPYLALPPGLIKGALWVMKKLRATQHGPEQVTSPAIQARSLQQATERGVRVYSAKNDARSVPIFPGVQKARWLNQGLIGKPAILTFAVCKERCKMSMGDGESLAHGNSRKQTKRQRVTPVPANKNTVTAPKQYKLSKFSAPIIFSPCCFCCISSIMSTG